MARKRIFKTRCVCCNDRVNITTHDGPEAVREIKREIAAGLVCFDCDGSMDAPALRKTKTRE